ncbi:MAG: LLM class flavin-dependent oxidoreductase [Acidimicrobiales bacterium]
MKTDLVISSFNADLGQMVELAAGVDPFIGIDGLWTYDHFSGAVAGAEWSRDPFVALGAAAAVTRRAGVGVLVANMVNRHPAQLASAINSLQNLAPGRVTCGLGAGAAPGSRFAAEQEAIGRRLGDKVAREAQLVETIEALRSIWRDEEYRGEHVVVSGGAILDDHPPPRIIVGASSRATVALAAAHADGVNIRASAAMADQVSHAREQVHQRQREPDDFEVSIMLDLDPNHPLGGDPRALAELGVDRRILAVTSPYPHEAILRVAENLSTQQT